MGFLFEIQWTLICIKSLRIWKGIVGLPPTTTTATPPTCFLKMLTAMMNKENVLNDSDSSLRNKHRQRKLKPSCAHPCRSTTHSHTNQRPLHRRSRSSHPHLHSHVHPPTNALVNAIKAHREAKLLSLHTAKQALLDKLPMSLSRPEGSENWSILMEGDKELEGVPEEYVRDTFRLTGSR